MYIEIKSKEVKRMLINGIQKWGYYIAYKDEAGNEHKVRKGGIEWSKKDATDALDELINNLKNTSLSAFEDTSKKHKTIETVYSEFVAEKQLNKRYSERTKYDNYNVARKHILSKFIEEITNTNCTMNNESSYVSKPIHKINEKDIEKWRECLANGTYTKGTGNSQQTFAFSDRQIKKVQILCKSIFEFAKRKGYITKNPFDTYQAILSSNGKKKQKIEYSIISKIDFQKLITAIRDFKDEDGRENELEKLQDLALFTILFQLGLRLGECLALTIGDYDPNNRILNISKNYDNVTGTIKGTKTENSDRKLFLGDSTHFQLMNLIEYYKRTGYYDLDFRLFTSFTTAKRRPGLNIIGLSTVRRRRDKYLEASNLPNMRIHDFRHSCATHLLNNGLTPFQVGEFLGDEERTITNTYGHLNNIGSKKIADAFE